MDAEGPRSASKGYFRDFASAQTSPRAGVQSSHTTNRRNFRTLNRSQSQVIGSGAGWRHNPQGLKRSLQLNEWCYGDRNPGRSSDSQDAPLLPPGFARVLRSGTSAPGQKIPAPVTRRQSTTAPDVPGVRSGSGSGYKPATTLNVEDWGWGNGPTRTPRRRTGSWTPIHPDLHTPGHTRTYPDISGRGPGFMDTRIHPIYRSQSMQALPSHRPQPIVSIPEISILQPGNYGYGQRHRLKSRGNVTGAHDVNAWRPATSHQGGDGNPPGKRLPPSGGLRKRKYVKYNKSDNRSTVLQTSHWDVILMRWCIHLGLYIHEVGCPSDVYDTYYECYGARPILNA
jgi:hypothetical protein